MPCILPEGQLAHQVHLNQTLPDWRFTFANQGGITKHAKTSSPELLSPDSRSSCCHQISMLCSAVGALLSHPSSNINGTEPVNTTLATAPNPLPSPQHQLLHRVLSDAGGLSGIEADYGGSRKMVTEEKASFRVLCPFCSTYTCSLQPFRIASTGIERESFLGFQT